MRRFLLGLGLLVLALVLLTGGVGASPQGGPPAGDFVPGEILVRWQDHVPAAEIEATLATEGLERIDTIDALKIDRLRVPVGRERQIIARLQADPRVAFAEPNYIARAAGIPNDPDYWRQWNLEQISAPNAWDLATGNPNLKIAIIDSGVDVNHPELGPRLEGGWDYVRNDAVPDDEYGHGTHVAGIIGAITNNQQGVAGTSWYGQMIPYKVLDQAGRGTYADIASAIVSAQEKGAHIINLSLGGSVPSQTLLNAVNAAYNAGALLVAATGNNNGPVNYPAAYPQVIAVAATTHLDRYAWYSNFGPEVDVAAPGGLPEFAIYSTIPNGYGLLYGTSMAAAHVSGLAALIWSMTPQLSNAEVRQIIEATTEQVDATSYPYVNGRNNYLGRGRINAEMALRLAMAPRVESTPEEIDYIITTGQPVPPRTVYLTNPSLQPISWQAQVLAGRYWLFLEPPTSGNLVYPDTAALSLTINTAGMTQGTYTGLVRVTGSSTSGGQQLDIYVQVRVIEKVHHMYLPHLTR